MRVGVLGPLLVEIDGARVEVDAATARRALLYLTLHAGTVVTVDRLAHAVWGVGQPPDVPHAVHSLVYRVRRRLTVGPGDVPVVRRGPGYLLDVDRSDIDVNVFEDRLDEAHDVMAANAPRETRARFASALELWRGEPYLDVIDETWAIPESRRVCERYVAALEAMARCDVRLGHLERAIADLTGLTGTYPLRESLWVLLWRSLARCGRHAEVVHSHRRCRRLLDERYGIGPLDHLDDLAEELSQAAPRVE